MRTPKVALCAACGKRIRDHQSDLVLEDVAGGKPRFYHERCGGAVYALAMGRPGAYLLTVRHAGASRN